MNHSDRLLTIEKDVDLLTSGQHPQWESQSATLKNWVMVSAGASLIALITTRHPCGPSQSKGDISMAKNKTAAERAAEALLAELHKVLAESMLADLRTCVGLTDDGGRRVVPHQLYANIIKFLKDNHIEAILNPGEGEVPENVMADLTQAIEELGRRRALLPAWRRQRPWRRQRGLLRPEEESAGLLNEPGPV